MYDMLIKKIQNSIETPHPPSADTKIKAIRKSLDTFMKDDWKYFPLFAVTNWDPPTPSSASECAPFPRNQRGGGRGHTRLRVRGWGSPNSNDWKHISALCLLYVCSEYWECVYLESSPWPCWCRQSWGHPAACCSSACSSGSNPLPDRYQKWTDR